MIKYYQNEPRFNSVYSRDNLPYKIKDGAYTINLNDYSDIGTHRVVLYALNKHWIQAYDSIMCGYLCHGFIDFMLAGKTLTDFTNLIKNPHITL